MCTHNSARSQMAEVILPHLAGDRFEASSAGTKATYVRPLAVRAMDEIGVDISAQESKELQRYQWESLEYVVTVCDETNEACPVFPWAKNRLQLVLREAIVGHRQRRGAPGDVSEGAGPNQGLHRERARADGAGPPHPPTDAVSFSFSTAAKAFGSRRSNPCTN
ncbi:MAG TPA: arsenate reductase ArsC [Rubrobacteraceae bacterium]|nr:arsenate reductase ArsC [Rubrobacteraceae bacterium]